jgi:hypothetical protein
VRGLDFKRVHFLTKCFPAKQEEILKKARMSRQRSQKLAPASEEIAKYSGEIFEFTEQECLGQIAAQVRRSRRRAGFCVTSILHKTAAYLTFWIFAGLPIFEVIELTTTIVISTNENGGLPGDADQRSSC